MKVLITFAVPTEFSPWRRLHDFRMVSAGDSAEYQARTGAADLRVVLTGMGREPAARAVRAALGERPDVCISSGFAGALRPDLAVGDIFAAGAVRLGGSEAVVRCDHHLTQLALRCGAKPLETLLTAEALVRTPREKEIFAAVAGAVEMESHAVLAEAAREGVPAIAVRAISDEADSGLPYDFARARDVGGQLRKTSLVAQVLRRPQGFPALVRLSRDCLRAAEALAIFLDRYISVLPAAGREFDAMFEVAAT